MRIEIPRCLCRLWIAAMNMMSVCDAISPDYHEEPIDDTPLLRGLSAIQAASRDNVIEFQRRRQLTACCESSPFRKSVQ